MRIARDTASRLDEGLVMRDEDVLLDERFHAGVYGMPDEGTMEAMKRTSPSSIGPGMELMVGQWLRRRIR